MTPSFFNDRDNILDMTITLFHYDFSPYAEKIRCMLGYGRVDWDSYRVNSYPPRPAVDALTGGYLRIPVAQIGADIFCDSQVIAGEVAALAGDTTIGELSGSEEVRELARRAQDDMFFAVFASSSPLKMLPKMLVGLGPKGFLGFLKDRMAMVSNSPVDLPSRKQSQLLVNSFLDDFESLLADDFLSGDKPTAVDFCIYHPLWALRDGVNPRPPKQHPKIMAWMDRMASFSKKPSKQLTQQEVFENAKAPPRPLPDSHDNNNIGKMVEIGPSDYRLETVKGELVAETEDRWILKRSTAELGDLHVHFPKQGFRLS